MWGDTCKNRLKEEGHVAQIQYSVVQLKLFLLLYFFPFCLVFRPFQNVILRSNHYATNNIIQYPTDMDERIWTFAFPTNNLKKSLKGSNKGDIRVFFLGFMCSNIACNFQKCENGVFSRSQNRCYGHLLEFRIDFVGKTNDRSYGVDKKGLSRSQTLSLEVTLGS